MSFRPVKLQSHLVRNLSICHQVRSYGNATYTPSSARASSWRRGVHSVSWTTARTLLLSGDERTFWWVCPQNSFREARSVYFWNKSCVRRDPHRPHSSCPSLPLRNSPPRPLKVVKKLSQCECSTRGALLPHNLMRSAAIERTPTKVPHRDRPFFLVHEGKLQGKRQCSYSPAGRPMPKDLIIPPSYVLFVLH